MRKFIPTVFEEPAEPLEPLSPFETYRAVSQPPTPVQDGYMFLMAQSQTFNDRMAEQNEFIKDNLPATAWGERTGTHAFSEGGMTHARGQVRHGRRRGA